MGRIPYKKIPKHTDRYIKRSIRFRIFGEFVQEYVLSRMTFALGMAVFALMFYQSETQLASVEKESEIYAAVLDQIEEQNTKDQESIVHLKMHVEEGRDKSLVVARLNELDPAITAQVPQRSETVELWQHGANVMTLVRSELPQQPSHAFMNLKRDDHVHVLRYEPSSCALEEQALRSLGCDKERSLTDEQQAHRKLFDSVHNIEADYQELLSVHTKPFQVLDLEPMSFDRVEETSIILSAHVQKGLKREYAFSKSTLELQSITTLLNVENAWYEMSVIKYELKENIEPEQLEEIFDPQKYPLKQTELIRAI